VERGSAICNRRDVDCLSGTVPLRRN